jgi:hypothetical protein
MLYSISFHPHLFQHLIANRISPLTYCLRQSTSTLFNLFHSEKIPTSSSVNHWDYFKLNDLSDNFKFNMIEAKFNEQYHVNFIERFKSLLKDELTKFVWFSFHSFQNNWKQWTKHCIHIQKNIIYKISTTFQFQIIFRLLLESDVFCNSFQFIVICFVRFGLIGSHVEYHFHFDSIPLTK